MIPSDENALGLMSAASSEGGKFLASSPDPFTQTLKTHDSLSKAVTDSLVKMDIHDVKDVVTGKNTLLQDSLSQITELTVAFIPKLLIAILILWLGMKLTKLLRSLISKALDRRHAESSLKTFLGSLVDALLKAMIIIMAMDVVGIKATSFIAIIGAMGLAIGMAMQGTLQNFAGGVIILLLKPFKINDYIECDKYKGYVREIKIFNTTIQPFNGRTIIIPNSELANKSLINHTHEPIIRLDIVASVAYGTNLKTAKDVLMQVIDSDPLILHEPKTPTVAVSSLDDNSVSISMWMWVKTEDYWTVWMRIHENIYNALYENNIAIPFPQLDVHLAQSVHRPDFNASDGQPTA